MATRNSKNTSAVEENSLSTSFEYIPNLLPSHLVPYGRRKHIRAPFGVSGGRTDKKLEDFPGPCAYNQKVQEKKKFFTSNDTSPNNPPFDPMTNQENVFMFVSREKRFKDDLEKSYLPGPGEYELNESNHSQRKVYLYEKNRPPLNTLGGKRAISIPSNENCYGYKEDTDGIMKMNEDPDIDIKFQGTKDNSIGPDRYNIDISLVTRNRGTVDWSKSVQMKKKKNDLISSASILLSESDLPITKKKGRDLFKDRLSRVSKASSGKHRLKCPNSDLEIDPSLYKREECKDPTPGPSTYSPTFIGEKGKFAPRPAKLQNFGSSTSRKMDPLLKAKIDIVDQMFFLDSNKYRKKGPIRIYSPKSIYPDKKKQEKIKRAYEKKKLYMRGGGGPGSYEPDSAAKTPKIIREIIKKDGFICL